MELIEVDKKAKHSAEVVIKDQGLIRSYAWAEFTTLDVESDPLELLLFCNKLGNINLQASFIPHPIDLKPGEAIFLAFPRENWSVKIIGEKKNEFFITRMQVSTLHTLINPGFNAQSLKSEQQVNWRDLMRLIPVNPSLMVCFDQLFHHRVKPPFQSLFEKAKFLEIFSLMMEETFGQPGEICPVAMSPAIEHKLNQVRHHIIDNIDQVPVPEELALLYDLPRHTLKEGYKFKYGKTIHQYYSNHKLESAMQMLASGEMLVKEIAFKIGYQNPSHFISAFKKKYGFTPKQFMRREA